MLDIGLIRQQPDIIRQSLKKRGVAMGGVDEVLALDELSRKTTQKLELLQAESNRLSKTKESASAHKAELAKLKEELGEAKKKAAETQQRLQEALLQLPNLVLEDVPTGDANKNKVLDSSGDPVKNTKTAHEELLTRAGFLNLQSAAEFSGSRYRYLLGDAALMQWCSGAFAPCRQHCRHPCQANEIARSLSHGHGRRQPRLFATKEA